MGNYPCYTFLSGALYLFASLNDIGQRKKEHERVAFPENVSLLLPKAD